MAARRVAVALPIPLPPPVTSAILGIVSAGISMTVIRSFQIVSGSQGAIAKRIARTKTPAGHVVVRRITPSANPPYALHRDLGGLDHRSPFGELAGDEGLEVLRRTSDPLQGVLLEHGLALFAVQKIIHQPIHLADDVTRRTGRGDDRIPRGCLKALQSRLLNRRHIGQLRGALAR